MNAADVGAAKNAGDWLTPVEVPDTPVTFRLPPVTEVVIAIQFGRSVADLAVLAEFTGRVREEFPNREQQPPLPPVKEDFSVPPAAPAFSFEIGGFEMPRTLFISKDDARVLQLQEDRFVFNWRRRTPENEEYPRYRLLRQQFAEQLKLLNESVEAAGKELPRPNYCEVTYVNQIALTDSAEARHPDLSRILKVIGEPDYEFLPRPEDAQFQTRFRIEEKSGRGRFYTSVVPGFRPDGIPIHIMNLTSRLACPEDEADAGAMWNALDLGRHWIVRGFVDLTTPEMHELWELKEKREEN